jgi:hypothetical protein
MGTVLSKGIQSVKVIPMGTEEVVSLTHQSMDPLQKELHGLLLEPLHHCDVDIFLPNHWSLSAFFRGPNTRQLQGERSRLYGR